MELSILSLFLPEALLTHFSILGVEQLGLVEPKQERFNLKALTISKQGTPNTNHITSLGNSDVIIARHSHRKRIKMR